MAENLEKRQDQVLENDQLGKIDAKDVKFNMENYKSADKWSGSEKMTQKDLESKLNALSYSEQKLNAVIFDFKNMTPDQKNMVEKAIWQENYESLNVAINAYIVAWWEIPMDKKKVLLKMMYLANWAIESKMDNELNNLNNELNNLNNQVLYVHELWNQMKTYESAYNEVVINKIIKSNKISDAEKQETLLGLLKHVFVDKPILERPKELINFIKKMETPVDKKVQIISMLTWVDPITVSAVMNTKDFSEKVTKWVIKDTKHAAKVAKKITQALFNL